VPLAKIALRIAAILALLFIGIQFYQPYPRTNPPTNPANTIEANLQIPENIKEMLDRSCRSCHSHDTEWPWYSRVAPVSWLVAKDVHHGRKALNFSEWTNGAGKSPAVISARLFASCADVRDGRMPLAGYSFMHPLSKPDPNDVRRFCAWADGESKRLAEEARAKRKAAENQ
jgi:hypothetical protein